MVYFGGHPGPEAMAEEVPTMAKEVPTMAEEVPTMAEEVAGEEERDTDCLAVDTLLKGDNLLLVDTLNRPIVRSTVTGSDLNCSDTTGWVTADGG